MVNAAIIIGVLIGAYVLFMLVNALLPGESVPGRPLERHHSQALPPEAQPRPECQEVTFSVEGTPLSAWLFLPEDTSSPAPIIIMAHGLGGTKDMGLDRYAARFQQAGMAALIFDYRHQGASGGEPRHLVWIPTQQEDWAAAIWYSRKLKEVDPGRIALWGSSLSGGHVIEAAAGDPDIACVCAQVPFLDGIAGWKEHFRNLDLTSELPLVRHALRDLARAWMGLTAHKIPLVGPSRSLAMMADNEAWEFFCQNAPADFENQVCARIGVRLDKYRPIKKAPNIQAPVLLQICENDPVTPPSVVKKAEDILTGRVQVIRYPLGHFDIYAGENFDKAIEDQVDFFSKHLF